MLSPKLYLGHRCFANVSREPPEQDQESLWRSFCSTKPDTLKLVKHFMDQLFRKLGQKYKRAKEEADKWHTLQTHFLSLFSSAVSILERLPILMDNSNYGVLEKVENMANDLPAKQLETLESLFSALHKTLRDFEKIKDAFKRLWHESSQLLKAEKLQSTSSQAQQRFGLGPSLNECIEGLENLFTMHKDEYQLKVASVNALSYNSNLNDMVALQSIIADQPSIPPHEVQFIFDFFYAGYSGHGT
ncbi:hypothetical protein GOP47_0017664 [Adiantum capillus-veneris]|uniref:Uncharacterized protein n=1 Tax=Adiantum capillus-veneris TaxID=13818 RepID=A0A9D4ZC03_ADICA|nr:hypothetical protein GOP47_0017664 [Adiantum capillus-veneris]